MITLAWYLLKVIICSGILCGYYYIALRNKIFHRWNRFYLLASIVLALAVPLMKINIFQKPGVDKGTVVRMLQTISNSDEIIIEYNRNSGLQLSYENILKASYLLITTVFLCIFFIALNKISRLKKKYPETKLKGINFISTDAKGTPFSFFNSIFWNNAIDLHSRHGHQILNHEIAHVKEKHSYDKVFINVVLLFFWINPFFWLIQKKLSMIHEFIADKEALEDNDINAFAEMVLQTVYPGQHFSIINNFFHSPLKRRLIMFTKNRNPKASYVSRLLVLPLAAVVFFAFTLKMKTISISTANHYSGKKITVIIDAGHGGGDDGAIVNNIKEKDLNLSIAKEIKERNKNENLHIILTREVDMLITSQDRLKFAETNKADLLVSIHMDAEENKNTHSGLSILIPKDDNGYLKESRLLGSAIIEAFKNKYPLQVSDYLQQRKGGVWVLKANQFPSVLIEAGFLSTKTDLDYLIKPANQQIIAANILNGIEKYAEQNLLNKSNNTSVPPDTTPSAVIHTTSNSFSDALFIVDGKIVSKDEALSIMSKNILDVNVLKGESAIKKYGEKGKNGVVEINKKNANTTNAGLKKEVPDAALSPVYFADGKEISKDEMSHISPNSIEAMYVLKGENAIKKYGEKGKNGVVEITTKKENIILDSVSPINKIKSIKVLSEGDQLEVSYADGKIETLTKAEYERRGYRYKPSAKSIQNRNNNDDTIPGKLFTKVENEAEFPGGREAWLKYIQTIIQKNADLLITDHNQGTCLLEFIVNVDGNVGDVTATTMKNSRLAEVSVNAIKEGPKWKPAIQNGHIVASYKKLPVTFKIMDNVVNSIPE